MGNTEIHFIEVVGVILGSYLYYRFARWAISRPKLRKTLITGWMKIIYRLQMAILIFAVVTIILKYLLQTFISM
jgi:hypothetical protein